MWDLWGKKWYWDRLFSKFFGILLAVSFHRDCPYSYITRGMKNRPVGGHSSEI
jgi:hypothetical protein